MSFKINKQDLIDVVIKGNILETAIDIIFYNLYKHKLFVYMNDIYFCLNGHKVNPNDYEGVYNLYVYEIQYLIEIIAKTDYPFDADECFAILFFRNLYGNKEKNSNN